VWGIAALQVSSFLLSGAQYPGNSCWARPGWTAITLSYTSPLPVMSTPLGSRVVVNVPPDSASTGGAFDVTADPGILREDCTISLPGNARRTIFTAVKPGTSGVYSSEPPSPFFGPGWSGKVTVQGAKLATVTAAGLAAQAAMPGVANEAGTIRRTPGA
jgi:hypothetical protein